jgi:hypothetical protein
VVRVREQREHVDVACKTDSRTIAPVSASQRRVWRTLKITAYFCLWGQLCGYAADFTSIFSPSSVSRSYAAHGSRALVVGTERTLDVLAAGMQILADGTRLRILLLLAEVDERHRDAGPPGLPQPTVSHHLGLLRTAGWVQVRRAAKRAYWSWLSRRRKR